MALGPLAAVFHRPEVMLRVDDGSPARYGMDRPPQLRWHAVVPAAMRRAHQLHRLGRVAVVHRFRPMLHVQTRQRQALLADEYSARGKSVCQMPCFAVFAIRVGLVAVAKAGG